jgi:hypothetical protein
MQGFRHNFNLNHRPTLTYRFTVKCIYSALTNRKWAVKRMQTETPMMSVRLDIKKCNQNCSVLKTPMCFSYFTFPSVVSKKLITLHLRAEVN